MASRVESKPHCHCTAHGCADVVSCMPEEGRGIAQKVIALRPGPTPGSALLRGRFLVKVSRVWAGACAGTVQCLHRLFGPPQPIATRPTVLAAL
ncbi:hypothetical protein AUP68_13631 [Ilyonectria robusta]